MMMDGETEMELGGPPSWYKEIFPTGPQTGFYHKFAEHAVVCVERDLKTLVISFDNLSQTKNKRFDRDAWASKFLADKNVSHMGIFANAPTWFRDMNLIAFLEEKRDSGYFNKFQNVVLTGTSMGGFAAITFSSLIPESTVVAFSPQSTLDTKLVPWEDRFKRSRRRDWSLPYSDAAKEIKAAKAIYLIFDPLERNDRLQAGRLQGDNVIPLKAPGLGHKTAFVLRHMQSLKPIMEQGIDGTLTLQSFSDLIECRKTSTKYRKNISTKLRETGHPRLQKIFLMGVRKRMRAMHRAETEATELPK